MRIMVLCMFLLMAPWLAPAQAALKVFACEPEWGALVKELAGNLAEVTVATTALQDPHAIQARPSLIAGVRRADLLVCTGADLEIGWLPMLLQRGANPRVQPGQPGYFEAAGFVTLRDMPSSVDRAGGDVHPLGNPHIQTDPRNIARVARALNARLLTLDATHGEDYRRRFDDFNARWQLAISRWETLAKPLRGVVVVTQHKSWTYLLNWLGLREVATLEAKPGIPPSAAHLSDVLRTVTQQPARMVIHAAYQDDRSSRWLSERTRMTVVALPFTVGADAGSGDLFGLFDTTMKRLLEGAR